MIDWLIERRGGIYFLPPAGAVRALTWCPDEAKLVLAFDTWLKALSGRVGEDGVTSPLRKPTLNKSNIQLVPTLHV